jgi:preprotein translocase subunit SecA
VAETHATGRPVLIGTLDVAESEHLAEQMSQAGLSCVVLNAKNDAHEARSWPRQAPWKRSRSRPRWLGRGTDIRSA